LNKQLKPFLPYGITKGIITKNKEKVKEKEEKL
jgi:hypothetical protein